MGDSFDPPTGNFFLNVSGQRTWIADYSGLPIETQFFNGERFVKAWISGQSVQTNVVVQVSGVSATISVSGNPVLVSGQPVQISGQTVYAVSGKAYNYGFDPSGQTWNELYVDASGGHSLKIAGSFSVDISGQPVRVSGNMVSISGQPVSISGNVVVASVTTNISGQTVYLASGQNNVQISGQTVQIAGGVSVSGNVIVLPFTSVSGNAVRISGETIQIAGGINVSGSPVRISGETIYPVSGLAFNKAFDPSGVTWNDIWVSQSGGHRVLAAISGETVSIAGGVSTSVSGNMVSISGQPVLTSISGNAVIASTSISGQVVYLISGQNAVQISGQLVAVSGLVATSVSGNVVVVPSTSVSGNQVAISGQVVYLVSGQNNVQISGQTVTVIGSIATSVSGNMVSVSGQPARISGETVIAKISGETLVVPFTSVSGNMVSISGQAVSVSGNVVVASVTTNISGQTVYLVSGNNPVQNSGQTVYPVSGKAFSYAFDPSGVTWNELWVAASGSHNLAFSANVSANVSGNAVRVSGETVYLISGQNEVQLFALDPSGVALRPLIVNASGSNILRVDAGSINVSANVSGNVVYLTSGQNAVQISGQLVSVSGLVATSVSGNMVSISGQAVSISGNVVVASVTTNISGQVVYLASGQNNVQTSGQYAIVSDLQGDTVDINANSQSDAVSVTLNPLIVGGLGYGYDQVQDAWARLRTTTSGQPISGIAYRLVVALSGDPVTVSGNMVSVSGQPVSVSGNIINTSGQVAIISGQPVLVSGQLVAVSGLVTTSVSGNMVSVSGQPVATSISGNVVLVSGQTVSVSGLVATSVSGNMVTISGQPVLTSVSGNMVSTSGQPSPVSGQVVYLTSGFNPVAAFGFIDSSGQLTQLRVTQSGQLVSGIPHKLVVTFSGDSIIGSVSGNMVSVSGQPALISGQLVAVSGTVAASVSGNMVSISGQPVSVSGNVVVASVTTNISGQVVYLASGQNSVQVSGQRVVIGDAITAVSVQTSLSDGRANTDDVLSTEARMMGYETATDNWSRVRVTSSGQGISGIPYRLVVAFSGDPVTVSGNIVNTSGQVSIISGQPVNVSGNVVNVSGYVVRVVPEGTSTIRTASGLVCTSLSGGTQLPSLAADRVTIRMDPDHSGRMYLGSTTNPPFSGMGFKLSPGDGITLQITNSNVLQVFASTSGEQVFFIAEDM